MTESPAQSIANFQPFECEEPVVPLVHHNVFMLSSKIDGPIETAARVNDYFIPKDDDYETVEVCETRNRTIRPKAMNSINNQMISVVNTNEVIQSINTEECL